MRSNSAVAVLAFHIAAGIALGSPPVVFEENRGQAPSDVQFLSRAGRYSVLLARDGAAVVRSEGGTVRIGLAGAKAAAPVGLDLLSVKSNYFIGPDPAQWRTGVPNYARVRYAHTWPGIDVIWHGRAGEMEYDFDVAPGADPRRIRLSVKGAAAGLRDGALVVGDIHLRPPRAYQDGREVACRYELHGQTVRFRLGDYDRTRPLTIDPVLIFSTYLGGSGDDSAVAVRLDHDGNIYVAGTAASFDFPVTANAFQKTAPGGICTTTPALQPPCTNLFVSKFSGDGSTLLFSTYLGESGSSSLVGMAVDSSGNVYLTGFIDATDFPKLAPLAGYTLTYGSAFVAKLSADGSSLLYATDLPLTGSYSLGGVAVDAAGSVYLAGATWGSVPVVNAFESAHNQASIFQTTDSAKTWQATTGPAADGAYMFRVDPTNPKTAYLGSPSSLYKTLDGGASWTCLQQGNFPGVPYHVAFLYPSSLAIDPSNSKTLYLGTGENGVYKSTDGGASWTSVFTASPLVNVVAIDPVHTATLYAATQLGVYKSMDGGASWNPTSLMPTASNSFIFITFVIDPSTPSTLYAGTASGVMKSVDAGATWTAMTSGFGIYHLVIDPVNPQILYAANGSALYRTLDGGAHWSLGQWPSPPDPTTSGSMYVTSLLVDPLVHTTVWAGTAYGLLVSRNSGATWGQPTTPLPEVAIPVLAADSAGTVYAIDNASGASDAFVMKLNPAGSGIVYSTYLGGVGFDVPRAIAVDSTGRAYVAGYTDSYDFPTANAIETHLAGWRDAFVSVLDPTGSKLVWSTYLGGSGEDQALAIAVDSSGDVHLAGFTNSSDFPVRLASQSKYGGDTDGFAAKLKGDGSAVVFSTYAGGSGDDRASAVAADGSGNTYVAGATSSPDLPVSNAIQATMNATQNAFVGAWNGQTGALRYLTYLGGSASDAANAIAADSAGNVYVAGMATSSDFPRKYAYQYALGGGNDAFLAKIAPGDTGPAIALSAVTNAASYATVVAPGEAVSIWGTNMAVTPATEGTAPLPVKLSDVAVTVNGVAAPLYYVSPGQINAQIPFETATGTAVIQVGSGAGTATLNAQVASVAPAIFTGNAEGTGVGAIEHGLTGQLVTDASPAAAGEVISIYCTGLGVVNPAATTGAAASSSPLSWTVAGVKVYIGGAAATVSYAGLAPGFAGLYQINAQVPTGTASGAQSVQVSAGGAASNTVTLAVH